METESGKKAYFYVDQIVRMSKKTSIPSVEGTEDMQGSSSKENGGKACVRDGKPYVTFLS